MIQQPRIGRMSLLILGSMLMLAGACGTTATPETASSLRTTEADGASSSTATTGSSAPEPSTTLAPTKPSTVALPMTEYALPTNLRIHSVALGTEHVVVAGWSDKGEFLGRADQLETVVPLSDLFPENDPTTESPTISSLVWFRGRFFAFTMFDPTAGPSAPTVVTSTDGLSWEVGAMAVVADAGLFFTPDSPADPEHAGVGGAVIATSGGTPSGIAATGWGVHRGQLTAMLWETTDGETWTSTPLPNQMGFSDEVGFGVVSSDAGEMIRLGGPLHTGVGTIVRQRPGDEWEVAPVRELNFASGIGANDEYLYYLEAAMDDQPHQLHWRASDETTWNTTELPPELDELGWNLSLEASSWHDPILIQRLEPIGLVLWTLDRGSWTANTLDGDSLLSVDADHLASTTDNTLLVYDRRQN